ncbi:PTS sugar transporter subunit IIA [Pectinatus frisingensis]|uniref:PTS sugar transporter subunit IIA n=1 Tax=Pectinatus frisingensis TaxID=865 RepID=UPI0018C52A62|nr:PTS sugar transporter subunit IIA [Pectinatus frisingensis]
MGVIFRELIDSSVQVDCVEKLIKKMGEMFVGQGFVKDSYIAAVQEREKKFPTGLNLKSIAIAMPHTDSIHVKKTGICVGKLNKPIDFRHMGNINQTVHAELIFMMAILDPKKQIDTLRKVLEVFQNDAVVREFKNSASNEELYDVAKKYLD